MLFYWCTESFKQLMNRVLTLTLQISCKHFSILWLFSWKLQTLYIHGCLFEVSWYINVFPSGLLQSNSELREEWYSQTKDGKTTSIRTRHMTVRLVPSILIFNVGNIIITLFCKIILILCWVYSALLFASKLYYILSSHQTTICVCRLLCYVYVHVCICTYTYIVPCFLIPFCTEQHFTSSEYDCIFNIEWT